MASAAGYNVFVVTFDMLKSSNVHYVPKTVTIYNILENSIDTFQFKPPYSESQLDEQTRKINKAITKKVHGIDWYDGYVDMWKLTLIIDDWIKSDDIVYMKGSDMCAYMKRIRPNLNVIDMEKYMSIFPQYQSLPSQEYMKPLGSGKYKRSFVRAQQLRNVALRIHNFFLKSMNAF